MNKNTHYELTFIIDGNIPETEHQSISDNIRGSIEKKQGKIISEDSIGRKKLSYPIKKVNKGVFISLEFDIDSQEIKNIDKELKLNKNILRFIITNKPNNIGKPRETKIKPEPIPEKNSPIKKSTGKELPREIKKKPAEKNSQEIKEKIDTSELDKKLDEILNDELLD